MGGCPRHHGGGQVVGLGWKGTATSCSLPGALNVPKEIRQADQPDTANLAWALEAVGPHGRPVVVGRAGEDQVVEGRPAEAGDWAPATRPWEPDVSGTGGRRTLIIIWPVSNVFLAERIAHAAIKAPRKIGCKGGWIGWITFLE